MKVVIATEGTASTGYGHLTRCLAIYQGFFEKKIIPIFVANCDEGGNQILKEIQFLKSDWVSDTKCLLRMIRGSDITLIDSYLADLSLYKQIAEVTKLGVYVDDTKRLNYPQGVIINGAVGAEKISYDEANAEVLLLGLNYAPLRMAFWDVPPQQNKKNQSNVLIIFGGNDTRGITFKVLDLVLKFFPQKKYHIVLGFGDFEENTKNYLHNKNVKFYHSLDANGMVNLMLSCDLAISAAGQTTYELARLGIPSVYVQIVDNQASNIEGWFARKQIFQKIQVQEAKYLDKIIQSMNNIDLIEVVPFPGQGVRNIVKALI
jgi:UDP-2,4-diacetamido-2,4,6-trideoxy-beta-L-altropyranose hydrolase